MWSFLLSSVCSDCLQHADVALFDAAPQGYAELVRRGGGWLDVNTVRDVHVNKTMDSSATHHLSFAGGQCSSPHMTAVAVAALLGPALAEGVCSGRS